MPINFLVSILIIVSSFVFVTGQTPTVGKEFAGQAAKTTDGVRSEKVRDIPFPAGVDLQFIIKELARDMVSTSCSTPNRSVRTAKRRRSISRMLRHRRH